MWWLYRFVVNILDQDDILVKNFLTLLVRLYELQSTLGFLIVLIPESVVSVGFRLLIDGAVRSHHC